MSIKNNYPTIRPSLDLNFAGSKVVDPRVTFTRPSTATYYDGKTVAKAEENLWINSSTLLLSTPAAVTRTDNTAVAPDGTTTAFSIIPTADNVSHTSGYAGSVPATAEKPVTLSFHAKANGYTKLRFGEASGGRFYGLVDLNTAAITSSGGGGLVTASAKVIENGWVRVFITINNVGNLSLCPVPDSGYTTNNYGIATFAGDGVSGCYLWGFQAEQRDQATAYTPTTNQPITRYQPVLMTAAANTPRIDHDLITGECDGLLIEESRMNLLTYSSDLGNADWAKAEVTVQTNSVVAPDGTLTADKLIPGTTTGSHRTYQIYTATQNTTYTFSCYVKSAGSPGFVLNTSGSAASAAFNLITASLTTTGSATGASGVSGLISPLGNGWFRCSLTFTWVAPTVGTSLRIVVANSATNTQVEPVFTGDGYSGIYIWGAQLEVGAFPTSHIPTASAQVTRAADNAVMTGTNFSSWYRQDEFTLTADVAPIGGASSFAVSINNNFDQRALALQYCGGAGVIRKQSETYVNTVSYSPLQPRPELPRGSRTKTAASFKVGGYANNSFDGDIALGTIQIPRLPEHSALRFGNAATTVAVAWTGHIRRVTGYPVAISPANLQALTL